MTAADSQNPIFLNLQSLPSWPGCTVAIGNFDGVHLGHQALLAAARTASAAPVVALSFEPHPREYFATLRGEAAVPFRLTLDETKVRFLQAAGADHVVLLAFDPMLASLSAQDFIDRVLVQGLGAAHVVVGTDFVFGRDRGGSLATLAADGRFGVTAVSPKGDTAGAYSSSRVRSALAAGDLNAVACLLGRRHSIEGPVIHGEKRGRELGYPTANQSLERLALPPFGIYAVRLRIEGEDSWRHGVANLGIRPMFAIKQPILETYIFDFDQDIYGRRLRVEPVAFLRGEARFDSLDALISQMKQDCQAARAVFKSGSL